jgi:hypothetical protein
MPESSIEELPGLDVVRQVSAKGMDYLQHTKVFDFDSLVFFTAHACYGDDWRRTNLEWLTRARMVSERMLDDGPTHRPFRPTDALHPREIEMWRAEMIDEFSTALKAWANDVAHWMPLYGFLFPKASVSYRALNEAWYLKQMITPGRVALVDGDLGSGKTDVAFRIFAEAVIRLWEDHLARGENSDLTALAQELYKDTDEKGDSVAYDLLHSKGPRIISNVEIPNSHPWHSYFQFATRLSDVNIFLFKNAIDRLFSILILDEMGLSYNRKRRTSNQNMGLEGEFRLIRKPSAVLVVITQNKELDLPDYMRRSDKGAKTVVEKMSKSEGLITVQGVGQLSRQRVHGIPRTTLPFETRAMASMAVDHDPRILIEEVEAMRSTAKTKGDEWSADDVWKAMIEWLEVRQLAAQEALKKGPMSKMMQEYKRNAVIKALQEMNEESGELNTPEEVAEMENVSLEFVQECLGVVQAVQANPEPNEGFLEERVRALMKAKLPIDEIARLGGCSVEFVKSIKAKMEGEKKMKKGPPPAPPPPTTSPPSSPSSPTDSELPSLMG